MTGIITLTEAGLSLGPFNLYSDVDGYIVPFESSLSKSALLAGVPVATIPDGSLFVRIRSFGECTNYIDVPIPQPTTTTTTTVPACGLTQFDISTIEEATCSTLFIQPVDNIAYHDGEGLEPDTGDAIYLDCGETPYPDNTLSNSYITSTQAIRIISGVRAQITCK